MSTPRDYLPSRPRRRTSPSLSPGKRRVFIALTAAIPFLLIFMVEGSLRLFGYGPDVSLFTVEQLHGRKYYVMNPEIKARYFAHVAFSPTTSMDYFPLTKSPGTFRIFCLGGSTTVGFPYGYAGSFSSFLRDRLKRTFPDRSIEIINLAMTATNSYTVLDVMDELPAYEPDLVIVYDGHNEFYGALGGASHETAGGHRWLVRLYLKAVRWKTFLFLRDISQRLSQASVTRENEPGGTMMERLARGQYVALDSPLYSETQDVFRENIVETASIARRHGIPVIFGTQVSNLRDLAPFRSDHSAGIDPRRRLEFASAMNEGFRRREDSSIVSALHSFREALTIDPARGDAHYEVARCLDTLNVPDSAFAEYSRARDLDQLRFRASSGFNDEIRAAAHLPGMSVADCERKFRANSPKGLIGRTLILEHLHPNLRGQFLIAKEYAAEIRAARLLGDSATWDRRDTVSDDQLWDERSVTALDELAAARRIASLTSSWPFREGRLAAKPLPKGDVEDIVTRMTNASITWEEAHVAVAEYYRRRGDVKNLALEYRTIMAMLPVNISAYLLLGELYYKTGDIAHSWEAFQRSLPVERTHIALTTLGAIALQTGKPDSALVFLRQAQGLAGSSDERVQTGYLLSAAFLATGDTTAARIECTRVLSLRPGFPPAERLLVRMGSTM